MTSVRTRILLFFTLFAAASLFAVMMSGRSTQIVGDAANSVVFRHLPMVHALGEMEIALQREDNTVYRYLVENRKLWLDECEKQRLAYTRWFTEAQAHATEAIERDKLSQIDDLYVQYDNEVRQILLSRVGSAASLKMLETSEEHLRQIEELVDQIKGIREGMTIVRQEQITDTLRYHGRVAVTFMLVIAAFFFGLAFYLWRFLVHPLSLLLDGIRSFTRGKSDVQIPKIGKDELGELQEAFNEMSRELDVERKRLRNESQSDALTGLFNMRYFRSQLVDEFSRSQRYSRPLTLLMIDVDHFKAYNDRNGHPAGDIVLKEVSRILIRNVRGTDIVARYGGEEFVVLLPETPLDAGTSVAEKVRKAVEEHYFPFAGSKLGERLTVSIGIASYPDSHISSDQDLIEASDKALYGAKRAGRNRVSGSASDAGDIPSPRSARA
ncbi:MAG: diguanylate cyclase [Elusimicrobia bacterium]|nr:diguanylate cyclase [Elusimicrobiota bacterium]